MHFTFRGVNQAFRESVHFIQEALHENSNVVSKTTSRNGDVIRFRRPVIFEYSHPLERVLFNEARDANPFFHIFEAMYFLSGRNDLQPLEYYISDYGRFSDDGNTLNGSYGYRWRNARVGGNYFAVDYVDQLKVIIDHLKSNPTSRRAVLHISNVKDDLLKMDTTKDQACNLVVLFEIEKRLSEHEDAGQLRPSHDPYLNMTVYNRSNDMILGALGANYVHFTILMEYMAACIGVEVGTYCQVSNNMHCYLDPKLCKPEKWLNDITPDYYQIVPSLHPSRISLTKPIPLVKDPSTFDKEIISFVERHSKDAFAGRYEEPFLMHVAQPMLIAFHHHKNRKYDDAINAIEAVRADDWRIAGTGWINKRKKNWENKNLKENER